MKKQLCLFESTYCTFAALSMYCMYKHHKVLIYLLCIKSKHLSLVRAAQYQFNFFQKQKKMVPMGMQLKEASTIFYHRKDDKILT